MTVPALRKRLLLLVTLAVAVFATLALFLRFGPRQHHIPYLPIDGQKPSVTLVQGTYIGSYGKFEPQILEQFRGIPYALFTGGERRFKAPVPVPASTKSYNATKFGNVCPAGNGSPQLVQDEDCLNVNVYRPKKRPSNKKLPVLVHIHGGAFNFGSGRLRRIDNMVAWSAEPFIGVTFNYRMGAFGFLPSKLSQKEGLLNAGLKDQALLLQWIQDNIAEFGGDPGDVTLMGESAGAHSVCIFYFRMLHVVLHALHGILGIGFKHHCLPICKIL
jgi:carboxylesterase type B